MCMYIYACVHACVSECVQKCMTCFIMRLDAVFTAAEAMGKSRLSEQGDIGSKKRIMPLTHRIIGFT